MPSLSDNEVKIKISTQADNSGIKSAEDSYKSLTSSVAAGNAVWDITKNSLIGIKNAVVGFVQNAADVEMLRTSLDTLTGSAEAGKNMFSQLYQMASKTPFETTDLVSATKTLLSYGVAQEAIIPQLKMIGDIAMGDKNKLSSLALAFGQVQAKGRLMGGELLQMVNTGFNPLQVISKQTGESMLSLTKKMEAGQISVQMVEKAMESATSQGGLFYEGMDRGSRTLSGTWSTLQDNIGMLTRKLVGLSDTGEVVQGGLFDKIAKGVQDANKWFDDNKQTVEEWSNNFTDAVKVMWDVGTQLFKLINDIGNFLSTDLGRSIGVGVAAIGLLQVAFSGLVAAIGTPIVMPAIIVSAAIGAIASVTVAYNDMKTAIDGARKAEENMYNTKKAVVGRMYEILNSGVYNLETKARAQSALDNLSNVNQATQIGLSGSNVLSPNLKDPGMKSLSAGGYTGSGGTYEVAGIVHKGEYVVPKSQVDQSTGLPKSSAGGIVINNTNIFNRESDSTAFVRELGYMLSRA